MTEMNELMRDPETLARKMVQQRVTADPEVSRKPAAIESGRYAIFETPDGGWVISRATGTCDTCRTCGCGEQQEQIVVPGFAVALLSQPPKQRMAGLMKVLTGRG